MLGGLCGAGITGNLLTIVILQRDNDKKNSTNWLLQAHAVFDSIYLLARLLARQFQFLACRHVEWLPVVVNQQLAAAAPYMASTASLAHMVSIWTMVVITVDRYIAVCLPGEVQLRTVRRVKVAVAYVTVLSIVCCLPLFFDWRTDSKLSPVKCDERKTKSVIIANPVPVDESWWFIAHQVVCDSLIRTLIPFLMLLALDATKN